MNEVLGKFFGRLFANTKTVDYHFTSFFVKTAQWTQGVTLTCVKHPEDILDVSSKSSVRFLISSVCMGSSKKFFCYKRLFCQIR